MAAESSRNNNAYYLKSDQKDDLFGKAGRMINQRIYDVLPEVSKDRFEQKVPRAYGKKSLSDELAEAVLSAGMSQSIPSWQLGTGGLNGTIMSSTPSNEPEIQMMNPWDNTPQMDWDIEIQDEDDDL